MKNAIYFIAALCLGFACLSFGTEFKLVIDGKANSRINYHYWPRPPELQATLDLQEYLKKISGAHVVRDPKSLKALRSFRQYSPEFVDIVIGTMAERGQLFPEKIREKLASSQRQDSFYILTTAEPDNLTIWIGSQSSRGVMFGVYAFLTDYLGVRFFYPGEQGENCPVSKNITVGDIDDFREPWMPQRNWNYWSGSVKPWTMEEVGLWMIRNGNEARNGDIYNYPDATPKQLALAECYGMVCRVHGGHNMFDMAIPKKLFETHPEYFPMRDGKRICETRSQRCFSSSVVQDKVVDYLLDFALNNPDLPAMIGYEDAGEDSYCYCPQCMEMGIDDNGNYSNTALVHRFNILIHNRLIKKNPQIQLALNLYQGFRKVPAVKGFHYSSNVKDSNYASHQRCYVHPLVPQYDCNRSFFEELNQWAKITPNLSIFDYYSYANADYAPLEYTLAKDMKFYRNIGLQYWMEDATNKKINTFRCNWQFYYAAMKLQWNTEFDFNAFMDRTYSEYYGQAAEPMKKYHLLRRELWESAPGHALYGGGKHYAQCLTNPAARKRMLGWLADAQKLAGDNKKILARVEMDRELLTTYWCAAADEWQEKETARKDVTVTRVVGEIKIDGVLDEEIWRSAPAVTGFVVPNSKAEPVEETRVRVLYDDTFWYIGTEAMTEHAWSPLKAKEKNHDGRVWGDPDHLEFCLVPPGDSYYHFVVNPLGTLYDARAYDTSYESKAEIGTSILKDRYVIEMKIPISGMKCTSIKPGDVWKFHAYRACGNLQEPKSTEGSSIDGVEPHDEGSFRKTSTGISVINNGDFTQLRNTIKGWDDHVVLLNGKWVQSWGGSNAALITQNDKNKLQVTDVIWTDMKLLPKVQEKLLLRGGITASGEGAILTVSIRGCQRPPEKEKVPFSYEVSRKITEIPLKKSPEFYPVQFDVEPYSIYTLDLRVRNAPAVIENVILAK